MDCHISRRGHDIYGNFGQLIKDSKGAHPLVREGRILMVGLWYQNKQILEYTIPKAQMYLARKYPKPDLALVAYMLALHEHDVARAGECLENVWRLHAKLRGAPNGSRRRKSPGFTATAYTGSRQGYFPRTNSTDSRCRIAKPSARNMPNGATAITNPCSFTRPSRNRWLSLTTCSPQTIGAILGSDWMRCPAI